METILLGGEQLEVPNSLIEDHDVFSQVLSMDTWNNVLTDEDKSQLKDLLPKTDGDTQPVDSSLESLFSGENVRFGNPVEHLWDRLNSGSLSPQTKTSHDHLSQLRHHQYKLSQQTRYLHLLKEVLLSRQQLLQDALFAGALENLPSHTDTHKMVAGKVEKKFHQLLSEIRRECKQDTSYLSSDDEYPTNQNQDDTPGQPVSEEDYRKMLKAHRKKRRKREKASLNDVVSGLGLKQGPESNRGAFPIKAKERDHVIPKRAKTDQEVGVVTRTSRQLKDDDSMRDSSNAQTVYEVYKPLDNAGAGSDPLVLPVRIEGPLSSGKFMSFFSLLKHVFKHLLNGKGELNKLIKTVKHVLKSPDMASCVWVRSRSDWLQLTLQAICYLSAEVGSVSSFAPLAHFIPIVEFRDRIDHWKWIGHARDSDVELLILCNHFLANLDRILPIVDYSEYEPPFPHVWTSFTFRPSTLKEITKLRQLEKERYDSPQKSFIYSVHGFEAPVGPVKGSRSTKKEASSKARGHALLIPQRPTCVTILSLVRDATSRLPNGEGTRIDLCVLVQDSQYLSDNVSDTQLNNAVSGALDRLHYEKDPCVRYDGSRKVWIYLHRGRSEEDFERIFWACEVAANQRKKLMSRPRIKPKVIMTLDGRETILEQGGTSVSTEDLTSRHVTKKGGKNPAASKSTRPLVTTGKGDPERSPHLKVLQVGKDATSAQSQSGKPSRKRKPTQKIAEQQNDHKPKRLPPPLTALPVTSLQASDWDSSDEEQVVPFQDTSLVSTEDKDDSASSWQSSDSEREDVNTKIVSMVTESGQTFRSSTPTNRLPSRLLSVSSEMTTPTFLNESADSSSAHFLPATPTQNFLPETPTVTTPTFIADISMEDESDVLSQQLTEGPVSSWLSSDSNSPVSD